MDQPRPIVTDIALVAFHRHGPGIVLHCSGSCIEQEVATIADDIASLNLGLDRAVPAADIWVWEGYYLETEESWCPKTIRWRQPSTLEWAALMRQESPWMPQTGQPRYSLINLAPDVSEAQLTPQRPAQPDSIEADTRVWDRLKGKLDES